MKNNLTELVFILDMSGSMSDLTDDTIGGFNSLIDEHKETGNALVTTVFFNDGLKVVHDRVPIEKVEHISRKDYRACGCTALIDAFATMISKIAMIHKYARAEDVPQKTIFTVITDGYENASRKYTAEQLKRKVEHEKKKYGWEFIFIGANIDAFETSAMYGIDADRTANYVPDAEGSRAVYKNVSKAVKSIRCDCYADADAMIGNIEMDFRNRGAK